MSLLISFRISEWLNRSGLYRSQKLVYPLYLVGTYRVLTSISNNKLDFYSLAWPL